LGKCYFKISLRLLKLEVAPSPPTPPPPNPQVNLKTENIQNNPQ
jgi:hypothetical protein